MIRLVSQGGTVLGYVVVGLRHINDCLLIKGESVPIQGPISAVHLQDIETEVMLERAFLTEAQSTAEALTHSS